MTSSQDRVRHAHTLAESAADDYANEAEYGATAAHLSREEETQHLAYYPSGHTTAAIHPIEIDYYNTHPDDYEPRSAIVAAQLYGVGAIRGTKGFAILDGYSDKLNDWTRTDEPEGTPV